MSRRELIPGAYEKGYAVVRLLIEAGASLDDTGDVLMRTALDTALAHDAYGLCALILSHQPYPRHPGHRWPGMYRGLDGFLAGRAWGPLHFAAVTGDADTVLTAMARKDVGVAACRAVLEARPWEPWGGFIRRKNLPDQQIGDPAKVVAVMRCGAAPFPALPSRTIEAMSPGVDPAVLVRVWPACVRRAAGAALTCLVASAPGGSAQDTALGRVFAGGHEDAWRHMLGFAMDWTGVGGKRAMVAADPQPRKRRRG